MLGDYSLSLTRGSDAGVVFALGAVGTAFAPAVGWLIGRRAANGIGIGIASFFPRMYIAELVSAKVRGSLPAVNMLAITSGIIVAYLVDYVFAASQGWRCMFGLSALPSIGLVIGMWWLPNSPDWLISRTRVDQARKVLQHARSSSDVEAEIKDIQQSKSLQGKGGFTGLFQPSPRIPMIVGVGPAIFQHINVINTVIHYAATILKFAGISGIKLGSAKKDYIAFPRKVLDDLGFALGLAQPGGKHPRARPWKGRVVACLRSSRTSEVTRSARSTWCGALKWSMCCTPSRGSRIRVARHQRATWTLSANA